MASFIDDNLKKLLTIAKLLGWRLDRVNSYSHSAAFMGEGNARFTIQKANKTGQWQVMGCWPKFGSYHAYSAVTAGKRDSKYNHICLSNSRSSQSIVNDIKRRFLPAYLDDLAFANANIKKELGKRQRNQQAIDVITHHLPFTEQHSQPCSYKTRLNIVKGTQNYSGSADFSRLDQTIELQLNNLTVEQLFTVINALDKEPRC